MKHEKVVPMDDSLGVASSSTSNGNKMRNGNENSLVLTKAEIHYLRTSWSRANTYGDVGAELVARLLNDPKIRFRALLEMQSGDLLGSADFTAEEVLLHPRAKAVGDGVVKFFNRIMTELSSPDACETIRELCMELGAKHYRWRVWFQAENWLCVKRCLLEAVTCTYKKKETHFGCLSTPFECRDSIMAWHRVIQFVVKHMKKGFLDEALLQRHDTPSSSSTPSCSSTHSCGSK